MTAERESAGGGGGGRWHGPICWSAGLHRRPPRSAALRCAVADLFPGCCCDVTEPAVFVTSQTQSRVTCSAGCLSSPATGVTACDVCDGPPDWEIRVTSLVSVF